MTYRELTEFAHAIGGDADKIAAWLDKREQELSAADKPKLEEKSNG